MNKEKRLTKGTMVLIIVLAAVLVLTIGVLCFLIKSGGKGPESSVLPETQGSEATVPSEPEEVAPTMPAESEEKEEVQTHVSLETFHGVVLLEAAYADVLQYTQNREGDVITEIFSLVLDDQTVEAFRICFGDPMAGNLIGYWRQGGRELPVTVSVMHYEEADFAEHEQFLLYQDIMDQLNPILNTITQSSMFTKNPAEGSGMMQQAVMKYWTVVLPEEMRWEEQEIDGQYRADFYGTIAGVEYQLYTITLRDEQDKPMGAYMVNGAAKILGVQVYSAQSQMTYAEDGSLEVYEDLMETVNDVLQVIMSSENYYE